MVVQMYFCIIPPQWNSGWRQYTNSCRLPQSFKEEKETWVLEPASSGVHLMGLFINLDIVCSCLTHFNQSFECGSTLVLLDFWFILVSVKYICSLNDLTEHVNI